MGIRAILKPDERFHCKNIFPTYNNFLCAREYFLSRSYFLLTLLYNVVVIFILFNWIQFEDSFNENS